MRGGSTWRTFVLSDVTPSTASPLFTRRSSEIPRQFSTRIIIITAITTSTQTAPTSAERQHNRIVEVLPGSGS